jgi:prepilin-type N-terminal cleavage/methylation domain-containing protein
VSNKNSFTLIEIIVVVIIVGVLAALALPGFGTTKERVLDREAKATLSLLQAAEKIYKMENGAYYASAVIVDINSNLKVSLPTGGVLNWAYEVTSSQATATRSGRVWTLTYAGSTAACTGTGCPP